ncbi:hypothetical protein NDU88_004444 [Pleurodeles waltl]|uniref:Uncharacterized protein n=1 Tax=Pleurodeles waltl TaxID=8319 RepID=A0AAV7SIY6_PLEWA|nr:hypothetical protein NDU88_004444 [Pleurodeles waltl]
MEGFCESVNPSRKCKLCTRVLQKPMSAPCGRISCGGCLHPWVVKQGLFPRRCQLPSVQKPHQVPPLRGLLQGLELKCGNRGRGRGCPTTVRLHHLAAEHSWLCEYSPIKYSHPGCPEVLNLKDVEQQTQEYCDYRRPCACTQGCGLGLQPDTLCCLRALRAQTEALRRRSTTLDQVLKRETDKWSNTERTPRAHASAHQSDLQFSAEHRRKGRLSNIAKIVTNTSNNKVREDHEIYLEFVQCQISL